MSEPRIGDSELVGDPELGGFRRLTRDDIASWKELRRQPMPELLKVNMVVRNDSDTWLAHRIRQAKAQMPSALFMCPVRGCSQNDGIARHWYHREKAESHQQRTGHRFIQI